MANLLPEIATNQSAIGADAKAKALLAAAKSYVIDCPEMAEAANEDLKAIKSYAKELETIRKEIKGPLAEKVKQIDAFFKSPADYLSKAESALKGSLSRYLDDIAAKRRAAEEKARRDAEAERKRMEAAIDVRAQQAESKQVGQSDDVVDAEFEVLPTLPIVTPTEVIGADELPALSGLSAKTVWKAEVTDLKAMLQAVIDGVAPAESVTVDQSFLNKLATNFKGALEIPGVKWVTETQLASRG